ncbi:hypothetical protein IT570_01535 [Candidatus Sumerlaeota bacterium]|nr:hypothetical protein [Candidatus Sumerlaeota bacterium]
MMMKKSIFVALAITSMASMVSAAPLFTEDFTFAGNLTANGWTAHSGAGTNPIDTTTGLTYAGYTQSGIGNAANIDDTGEDVNRTFTAQASGTVYASFMFNAPLGSTVTEGYFFTLGQQDSPPSAMNASQIRPKVFLTTDGSGDYELGFQYSSNTISNKTNLDLALGTTYLAVVKYVFNTGTTTDDEVSLYVFTSGAPGTEPGTPTLGPVVSGPDGGTDLANVGAVALRQYNTAEEVLVDGILVDTVWPLGGSAVGDWSMY